MPLRSRKKPAIAQGKSICTLFGVVGYNIDGAIACRLLAAGLLAGLSACANPYDPIQRALGGGLLGAGSGAAIGAAAGGGPGAVLGAAIGGAAGVVGGAATTPPPPGYYGYPGYPYAYPGYAYGYPYAYPGYYP